MKKLIISIAAIPFLLYVHIGFILFFIPNILKYMHDIHKKNKLIAHVSILIVSFILCELFLSILDLSYYIHHKLLVFLPFYTTNFFALLLIVYFIMLISLSSLNATYESDQKIKQENEN